MTYKEISYKTACHKITSDWLPYSWDLNVYRGCEHGCKYCYALYSHRYLGSERYYDEIYIKTNVAEQLNSTQKPNVIPFITDGVENADALFCNAKDSNVDYVLPSRLNLIGKTRRTFLFGD